MRLAQSRGVVGPVACHGHDVLQLHEPGHHGELVQGLRARHDPDALDVILEPLQVLHPVLLFEFHAFLELLQRDLLGGLNRGVRNVREAVLVQPLESARGHSQEDLLRASAQFVETLTRDHLLVHLGLRDVLVQDAAVLGNGEGGLRVVAGDHAHGDAGLLALGDGVLDRAPEGVLDADHALEHLLGGVEVLEGVLDQLPLGLEGEVHVLLAEGDVALALVRPGAQLALHAVLDFLRQGLLPI